MNKNTPSQFALSVEKFLRHLRLERNMSSNTLTAYGRDLLRLAVYMQEQFGMDDPQDLDSDALHEYLCDLRENGLQPRSVARHMSTIRTFGSYLVDRGLLRENPATLLELPKLDQDLPDVLTTEEVERLLSAPVGSAERSIRDAAMLETLYATGLRVSELVNLTLTDIDFDRGVVRCMGKGRKERLVPIGEVARFKLLTYLENARPALSRSGALRGKRNGQCNSLFITSQCKAMTRQGFGNLSNATPLSPASTNRFRRTSCATPLPRICWLAVRTCARCRRCWATRTSALRRFIRTCTASVCAKFTIVFIPAPDRSRRIGQPIH